VETWEPLINGVTWKRIPLVSFRRARADLEAKLGPPQARAIDSNGCGPYDAWGLRFSCGLEVLLLAFHLGPDFSNVPADHATWVEIQANSTDFAHIETHLPFELSEVSPWLPDRRTYPAPCWIVMRQDDNGNTFEVRACSSRCEAALYSGSLESLGHKQTYWVVQKASDAG
jgi:hypothetical protein